jgi:hypothetical protein
MDNKSLCLALLCCVIIYLLYQESIDGFVSRSSICNSIDDRCYEVVGKFEQSKEASELLAQINVFCIKMMRHLRDKYLWNHSENIRAKDLVSFLLSNYNPDGIIENAPVGDVNTSYVDDKGKVFAICLREKLSGKHKFHSLHDLEFVVLHEMAHMATYSYGHDADFWTNFKFLLKEANLAGLHIPVNYAEAPINYCSLHVDYNPYFDHSLMSI